MKNSLASNALVPVDGTFALESVPPITIHAGRPRPPRAWRVPWRRWSRTLLERLCRCERKWLMLDVAARIDIDAGTAHKGGTIRVRTAEESFYVRVPGGLDSGTSLRIPGRGESGLLNRRRGDLLLELNVARPSVCRRDVYHTLRVTRRELMQRKVFTLKTPEGDVQYALPRIVRQGQAFPVSGDGRLRDNHFVIIDLAQ